MSKKQTINLLHLFCIDRKHCDVYYANVPRNYMDYFNAMIKTYDGHSFALGMQISASAHLQATKQGVKTQNLDTPDTSCNQIKQSQTLWP